PLFLGFLKGVDFFWTASLWKEWLVANGLVLGIFYVWDTIAFRREKPEDMRREQTRVHRLRIAGLGLNAPLLALVLLGVLFQSASVGQGVGKMIGVGDLTLLPPWGEFVIVVPAVLSLLFSPRHL